MIARNNVSKYRGVSVRESKELKSRTDSEVVIKTVFRMTKIVGLFIK